MSIQVYWFVHLLAVFSLGCLGFCVVFFSVVIMFSFVKWLRSVSVLCQLRDWLGRWKIIPDITHNVWSTVLSTRSTSVRLWQCRTSHGFIDFYQLSNLVCEQTPQRLVGQSHTRHHLTAAVGVSCFMATGQPMDLHQAPRRLYLRLRRQW